jgi:hypothetical protein
MPLLKCAPRGRRPHVARDNRVRSTIFHIINTYLITESRWRELIEKLVRVSSLMMIPSRTSELSSLPPTDGGRVAFRTGEGM